jgi:hypothetical protein
MTYYGVTARLEGVWHMLRGHRVLWSTHAVKDFCVGDIVCESCNRVIWCRALD